MGEFSIQCHDPADPHRVSDELLRWYFRQSVLANMKGAGEPVFEHDFPLGTDMMRDSRRAVCARESGLTKSDR